MRPSQIGSGEILVVCQYERGLGNSHPEGALRLRQRFTEPTAEFADVSAMASHGADRLSGDGIVFGQGELKHPADQHRLALGATAASSR